MKWKLFSTENNSTSPRFLPIVLMLVLLIALVGCAGNKPREAEFTPTPVEIVIKVPYECGQPPPLNIVTMRDVEWVAVEENGIKYFALTPDSYQALGLNTSDWLAATKQLKARSDFYEDCIERSQNELDSETEGRESTS